MAVKGRDIAGPALGTAFLGLLLFRAAAPGPTGPKEPSSAKSTSSTPSRTAAKKGGKESGSEYEKEHTKVLKGPWIASQKHFAGQTQIPCPSEIEAIPATRNGKTGDATKTSVAVAFGDGTLHVTQLGSARIVRYPRKELWCIPDDEQAQAMIATVPDPVQTHMALTFDRTVEAIQLAAGSIDYIIDRYWLPWDIDQKVDWADYDSLVQATRDQKQKETQPGLLMFRRNEKLDNKGKPASGQPPVLYVFLVGETTTAGINGEQFKNALHHIHEIRTKDFHGCEPRCPIYIMGPGSSGSLASLRYLIDADPGDTFTIYSGSVSSSEAIKNAHISTFQTFVTTTEDAVQKLIDELIRIRVIDDCRCESENAEQRKCGSIVPQVAMLSEGGTTYGAVEKGVKRPRKKEKERESDKEQTTNYGGCLETFVYSREIASLRNAYQLSVGQKPAQDTSSASPKRPSLSSNLADQTNSGDEPPDFSKAQSPLSKEAVLMNVAAAMRRNHYKYIGVIGSNPLDVVFLVSFLRDAVPDARLFVLDPDLLLEHEPDNVPYMGTLYLTTYPLLSRRLLSMETPPVNGIEPLKKTIDHPSHLPFSTQYEDGQYNATICLAREMLGDVSGNLGQLHGRNSCPTADGDPSNPLWLMTIGTGGHWPIAVLSVEDVPDRSKKAPELPYWPRANDLPGTWTALAASLCALAILHILVLIGLTPFSAKFRDFTLGTVAPAQQLFAIHLTSATLAVALAFAGLAAWRLDKWTMAAGFSAGALSITCLLPTFKRFLSHKTENANGTRKVAPTAQPSAPSLFFIFSAIAAFALLIVGLAMWPDAKWPMATGFFAGALFVTCFFPTLQYFQWVKAEGAKDTQETHRTGWTDWPKKAASGAKAQLLSFAGIWAVAAVLTLLWWKLCSDTRGNYGTFFSYRAAHLANVVSPLTPMLPLLAALYLWAVFHIWRLRFDNKIRPRLNPSGESETGEGKLRPGWRSEKLIADAINGNFFATAYGSSTAVFFLVWFLLVKPWRAFEWFERPWFAVLYEFLFCLVILLILISGFRLAQVWQQLRRFLLELNRQRIRVVFSRLKGQAWPSLWFYGSEDAEWDYMVRSDEIIQQLKNGTDSPAKSWQDQDEDAVRRIRRTRRKLQDESFLRRASQTLEVAKHYSELEEDFHRAQDYLATILNRCLDILQETWRTQPPWVEENDEEPETTDRSVVVQGYKQEVDRAMEWQKLIEKYVALRYVAFIRAVLARIRTLLIFLAVSFSLVLISLVIYTFEPHRALIWWVTAIFIVIGFIVVSVLMQIHRDPILSRITGTKANELGLAFYVRIAVLGAAPLLTLLATQFPSIGRYLVSFLQPGLEALK